MQESSLKKYLKPFFPRNFHYITIRQQRRIWKPVMRLWLIFLRIVNGFHLFPKKFHHRCLIQAHCQKHLEMILDYRLTFNDHLEKVSAKVNRGIAWIEVSFVCPHLDYGDVKYEQAYNVPFPAKLESHQKNVALAVTGAINSFMTYSTSYRNQSIDLIRYIRTKCFRI